MQENSQNNNPLNDPTGTLTQTFIATVILGGRTNTGWSAFVERYGKMLEKWCKHKTYTLEETDELLSDLWFAVMQKLKGYQGSCKFRVWLHMVFRTVLNDFVNKQVKKRKEIHIEQDGDFADAQDEELVNAWLHETRLEIVKQVIIMKYGQRDWDIFAANKKGTPSKVLAEQYGVTIGRIDNIVSTVGKFARKVAEKLQQTEWESIGNPGDLLGDE